MLKFELNRKLTNNLTSDLNSGKSIDFQSHKSYTNRCKQAEKTTARKSTFDFSRHKSQRSKNQKSFHFPTTTQPKYSELKVGDLKYFYIFGQYLSKTILTNGNIRRHFKKCERRKRFNFAKSCS